MKSHRKPDLLFVLAVIAGFGVTISSYIQYVRANANVPEESSLATKQLANHKLNSESSFILVSSQTQQASLPNGDAVNNSLPRP
ncbi:hypothetical protein [Kaarinaea lacus]